MELIKEFEMSMAIFAPGWVYETLDKKEFCNNQNKLVLYVWHFNNAGHCFFYHIGFVFLPFINYIILKILSWCLLVSL